MPAKRKHAMKTTPEVGSAKPEAGSPDVPPIPPAPAPAPVLDLAPPAPAVPPPAEQGKDQEREQEPPPPPDSSARVTAFLTELSADAWRLDVKTARLLRQSLAGDVAAVPVLLERLGKLTDQPAELRQAATELRKLLPE